MGWAGLASVCSLSPASPCAPRSITSDPSCAAFLEARKPSALRTRHVRAPPPTSEGRWEAPPPCGVPSECCVPSFTALVTRSNHLNISEIIWTLSPSLILCSSPKARSRVTVWNPHLVGEYLAQPRPSKEWRKNTADHHQATPSMKVPTAAPGYGHIDPASQTRTFPLLLPKNYRV